METIGALAEAEELHGQGQRPSRRGRVALWCALIAVVVGAVTVIALRDTSRTPAEDLARVRDFVGAAGTGHFAGETRSESGQGGDEPGSTSIDIARIHGRFVLPDRMQFVEDAGDYHTEGILLGAHSYFRSGESDDELRTSPWVYERLPDPAENLDATSLSGLDQAGAAAVSTASGLFGAFGTPFDLENLLARLDGVRRVSPGVLEAQPLARDFLADELVAAIEKEAAEIKKQFEEEDTGEFSADDFDISFLDEPVVIRLVHAPDGRLDQMVITLEDGTGEDRSAETSTLRFSRWGEPVTIERPGLSDVDLTPGIDEEKLASATFTVLAPAAPPAGFLLGQASVQDEDLDEDQCAGAQFWYEPADDGTSFADGEFRYFNVSITPTSCPAADEGQGGLFGTEGVESSVRIGAWQAELRTITYGDSTEIYVRFTAGDVVVESSSSLPEDQIVAALATLAPLDLAGQPVRRHEPPPAD